MTSQTAAADQAREAAREPAGQFGTQLHTDSGIVELETPARTDTGTGVSNKTAGACQVRSGTYGCDRPAGHTVGKHRGAFWSGGVLKIARFADTYAPLTVERSKVVNRCPGHNGTYRCDLETGHTEDEHQSAFRDAGELRIAYFGKSPFRTARLKIDALRS